MTNRVVQLFSLACWGISWLGASPSLSVARTEVVSIDFGTTVTRWDLDTGEILNRTTHSRPVRNLASMARLGDGTVVGYRTSYQGLSPALFSIDLDTGLAELIKETNNSGAAQFVIATTGLPSGDLLGFDNRRDFVLIDPDTLIATDITFSSPDLERFIATGGLATDSLGEAYGWLSYSGGANLFRFDVDNAIATRIGGDLRYALNSNFNALAFDSDDRLLGFTEINAGNAGGDFLKNAVYEIDTTSGVATLLVSDLPQLAGVRGAEIVLVPEPLSAAYLLAGACLLVGMRRNASA
ncbi:hypothetical protein MalM25_23200 [Planctomycetes bacterium MalM25]|nr:hypothetical protein MalM25_23200 [Planctomycetes bacterium MalM25]